MKLSLKSKNVHSYTKNNLAYTSTSISITNWSFPRRGQNFTNELTILLHTRLCFFLVEEEYFHIMFSNFFNELYKHLNVFYFYTNESSFYFSQTTVVLYSFSGSIIYLPQLNGCPFFFFSPDKANIGLFCPDSSCFLFLFKQQLILTFPKWRTIFHFPQRTAFQYFSSNDKIFSSYL